MFTRRAVRGEFKSKTRDRKDIANYKHYFLIPSGLSQCLVIVLISAGK